MFRLSTKSPFHFGEGWKGGGEKLKAPLDQQIRWLRREREPRKKPAEGGKMNEKRKQTGKMKTNPPNKPNSPPVAQTHHTQTKTVRERERKRESGLKRELPLCALHCGGNACSKPTRISLANWGKTFSFATRLRDGTSWRRAVRADGRVCCRKRQLTTEQAANNSVASVAIVATSDNRQRATCNCVN